MEQIYKIPYFNRVTAGMIMGKSGQNLNYWIKTRLKTGEIIALKKGLFISNLYLLTTKDRERYSEYLANVIRYPSYVSLEYALSIYGIIPEGVFGITCLTTKTPRDFTNSLGNFIYRNIKQSLFTGFKTLDYDNLRIKFASKAKALFDFLYFRKIDDLNSFRLNLSSFSEEDKSEFKKFVAIDNSKKMQKVIKLLKW